MKLSSQARWYSHWGNRSLICIRLELVGITNLDAQSEDLENDPFLNSALQRFTCELSYRFGSFLAPSSIGIIMSIHYLSEHNKIGERTSGDNENEQKLMGLRSDPRPTGPINLK